MAGVADNLLSLQQDASVIRVVFASGIILLNSISCGTAVAFSACASVVYSSDETPLDTPLNQNEVSWLMSIIQVAILSTTLFSGLISDFLGRKKTLLLGQIIILWGWFFLYLAPGFIILMVARCLMGVGVGIAYSTVCMFISEIALIRLRGTLAVWNTVMTNASFIYSLFFAATLSHQGLILMSLVPSATYILVSYFLPESHMWLMSKNRLEDAQQTLQTLRGPNYNIDLELKEAKNLFKATGGEKMNFKQQLGQMSSRTVLLPIIVMWIMFMLQPLTGSEMVIFYSLDIFQRANVQMNNYALSIMVQSGFLVGYIISSFLMVRTPRKLQFIASGLFMSASLVALGFILNVESGDNQDLKNVTEVLLPICVICAGLAYGMGMGPVLFALLGEILPQKVKSTACAIILSSRNLMSFINLKVFPSAVNAFGLHNMFWIHSGICILTCILAAAILPETRGLTLTELSTIYEKKKPVAESPRYPTSDLQREKA